MAMLSLINIPFQMERGLVLTEGREGIDEWLSAVDTLVAFVV